MILLINHLTKTFNTTCYILVYYTSSISAPGIAERIAFGTLREDETFFLFNKKNSDLVKLFRENLVGGPAIIFYRHQEAGEKIKRSN